MIYPIYKGNCPKNVARDAKYRIRTYSGEPVVELTYEADGGLRWLATTEEHPALVKMVNDVKMEVNERRNGSFYINEYQQVIVPDTEGNNFLAGEYTGSLRFEFQGLILSGEGMSLLGQPLQRGAGWDGPHPGIPYRLAAGGRDIYYKARPHPNMEQRICLSEYIGERAAAGVAASIADLKGHEGGRFYVNEWRQMFAPINGTQVSYIYLGPLNISKGWFPKL